MIHPRYLKDTRETLADYAREHGPGPHKAALLGALLFPQYQGPEGWKGASAAARLVRRLGCKRATLMGETGWVIPKSWYYSKKGTQ